MTTPNDPVFPHISEQLVKGMEGLTKREYFAAMAMRSMGLVDKLPEYFNDETRQKIVEGCVKMADALIAELNKQP